MDGPSPAAAAAAAAAAIPAPPAADAAAAPYCCFWRLRDAEVVDIQWLSQECKVSQYCWRHDKRWAIIECTFSSAEERRSKPVV